jgi:3-deoxy-manno-octulosonate cytidylyltransferase (CMP-KDO synthetase)
VFNDVIVATDDQRIFETVKEFKGNVKLTGKDHQSGTDRVAEVCENLDFDVVVNIQGDEPFIYREPLEKLVSAFTNPEVQVASLMHKLDRDINNPNNVKVVVDKNSFALYFSRSIIPFDQKKSKDTLYFKHIGVYAFRKETLLRFINFPVSKLEKTESLEQLRLLENGIKIKMLETDYEGIGIDTPDDLKQAEEWLRNKL